MRKKFNVLIKHVVHLRHHVLGLFTPLGLDGLTVAEVTSCFISSKRTRTRTPPPP